jgi:competence protein ComGC
MQRFAYLRVVGFIPAHQRLRRTGVSLIEVLVVIGIVGLLLALLLPAVQQSREGARRIECQSHMRQLAIANQSYEATFQCLPPGLRGSCSWLTHTLPYIEQKSLHEKIDFRAFHSDGVNQDVIVKVVDLFLCPSESAATVSPGGAARNSYAGNFGSGVKEHGYNGLFITGDFKNPSWPKNRYVRFRDVTDGLSQTAMVSEHVMGDESAQLLRVIWHLVEYQPSQSELIAACLSETPRYWENDIPYGNASHHGCSWMDGSPGATLYNHVLPPQQRSCFDGTGVQTGIFSAASQHPDGVNVVLADTHVTFVSASIDQTAWSAVGSRNGSDVGRLGL